MRTKQNKSNSPLIQPVNYMSWFEFWHPRRAAALKAEQERYLAELAYNKEQDKLEADTSVKLTDMDKEAALIRAENQKYIIVAIIVVVIIYLIIKFV